MYSDYSFGQCKRQLHNACTQQSSSGKYKKIFPNELQLSTLKSKQATPTNQPSLPNKLMPPKQIR